MLIQIGSVADMESATDMTDLDDFDGLLRPGGRRGIQDAVSAQRRQLSSADGNRRLSRSNKW